MQRYIARRLLSAVPILLGVSVIAFAILHLIPGDPISSLTSGFQLGVTAEMRQELEHQFGLDRPLPVQFFSFIGGAVQGDFGTSIRTGQEVSDLILEALPHTIRLAALAVVLAVVIGVSAGVIAAINHRRWPDSTSMFAALIGVSMPEFWFAILAILFLAVRYPIFPTSGTGGWQYLILPALVLGIRASAAIARLTRSSMLEEMNQQYIVTAEAKGMTRPTVLMHGLRNAVLPVITLIGLLMGRLLGGTVVVETIFNRTGLGKLVIDSIVEKDIPLLQGSILVVAAIYVLLNIVIDVSYGWFDPRIRYG